MEHLNFSTNAAEDDDMALNAWTAVDLDPDVWSPAIGAGPVGARCRGPMIQSCVLDSSQLAALSGSAKDDISNSECDRNLKRSNTSFSEWPQSYQKMLGEPESYAMSGADPEIVIMDKTDECEKDDAGSYLGGGSVISNMSSNIIRSGPPSIPSFSLSGGGSSLMADLNLKTPQMPGSNNYSDTSFYTGSTGLSIPSLSPYGKQSRGDDVMVREQAILRASLPTDIGGRWGHYVIAFTRTTMKQAFGLEFFTAENRDRTLSGIFVAKDMPHLGMNRWDKLRSINGIEPKTGQECVSMLKLELMLVLVLQSRGKQSTEPVQTPDMQLLPPRDQRLLTIKKEILEHNASEFKLKISRCSPQLSLDLPFKAEPSKSGSHGPLLATRDMPHLEILAGDQLLSLNGIRSLSQKVLADTLNGAQTLDFTLRRDAGVGKPPPSKQLGTYEEPASFSVQKKTGGSKVRERQFMCCKPDDLEQSVEFVPTGRSHGRL